MFEPLSFTAKVERFDGPSGWYYLPLNKTATRKLRPIVTETWPQLVKVSATIKDHQWTATVMPIKDGPLFIVLKAPVRAKLGIHVGQKVRVAIEP